MKKIIVILVLSLSGTVAIAQDMYDALNLNTTNYYGTARSLALGNAMTAVGGDIGSIQINPAGSAVYNHSVIAFSPALSFASTSANYGSTYGEGARTTSVGKQTLFDIPSFGFVGTFMTGRRTGLKKYTFGFVINTTNVWNDRFTSSGDNDNSSFVGAMANAAGKTSYSSLWTEDLRYSNVSWESALAARTYLIWPLSDDSGYVGATESLPNYRIPGTLKQTFGRQVTGTRRDVVLNFGLDVSDKFYFGFNLGFPIGNYRYNMGFAEYALDPEKFPLEYFPGEVINFNEAQYAYSYSARMSGIYGKFGIIWLPFAGLRIGASVQTPTRYNITENYSMGMASYFDNDIYPLHSYSKNYLNPSTQNTYGTYSYSLIAPAIFNVGAAYTFYNVAMLSFDFETQNDSRMGYGDYRTFSRYNDEINSSIREFAGRTNEYRVGLEVKPVQMFSIRVGYTNRASTEYYYVNNLGEEVYATDYVRDYSYYSRGSLTLDRKMKVASADLGERASRNTFSIGFGYSSFGSFYADIAYRLSLYRKTCYQPFSDYLVDNEIRYAPRVYATRNLSDVIVTFGWRF